MIQPKRIETAIRTLQADITAALTRATRGGLSHADAVLVAHDAFSAALRARLGDDWVRTLVGVIEEPKR
jgi:hypothetical protein